MAGKLLSKLGQALKFGSIKAKILLSFFILIAIYFVMNLIIQRENNAFIRKDILEKNSKVVLHLICNQVKQKLDWVERDIKSLADSDAMRDYIATKRDKESLPVFEFRGVSAYKRDYGWMTHTLKRPTKGQQTAFEEFAGAVAANILSSDKNEVVFTLYNNSDFGDPSILVAAPVRDEKNNRRPVGVVVGEIGISSIGIQETIARLKEDVQNTDIFVVSPDGGIMADSKTGAVPNVLVERAKFREEDETTDWISSRIEEHFGEYEVDGKPYIYASWWLDPRLDLRIFMEQPLSSAYAPIRNMNLKFMLAAAAIFLIAVILGYHRAVQISKPVMDLAKAANDIPQGDLSKTAPIIIQGNDEIASLAKSFNTMITALRDKMEQIQESQVDLEMAFVQMQKYSEEMEKINRNLQQRVVELGSLNEVAQSMTRSLDLDTVFVTIIDVISNVLGFSSCSLKLIDEKTDRLRVVISRGLSEEYKKYAPSRKVGDGISGNVAKRGKPAIVLDMENDPRIGEDNIPRREGFQSMMSHPLKTKEEVIGVINVYSKRPHRFTKDEIRLMEILANQAAIAIENAKLFDNIQENYIHTIHALSMAIDAKDEYTRGHSDRVTDIALRITRTMNLPPKMVDTLHYASELHDIGKIGISEMLIKKKSRLTEDEMAVIKSHPVVGESIVAPVAFLKDVRPIVRHHHERYDGKGYPDRLKGNEIPLLARILAVADAFDAMTSDRPYRKALSQTEALNELKRCSGTQFDPEIVKTFLSMVQESNEPAAADKKPDGFNSNDVIELRTRKENGSA